MPTKRQMLKPSESQGVNIDEMLKSNTDFFEFNSPFRKGVVVKLTLKTLKGEDILKKSSVYESNDRDQKWLDEKSLAPLILSLKSTNGQINPAIGRVEGEIINVICGSSRRLATYFAGLSYKIYVSEDITDEEANLISKAENIFTPISLIERGKRWHQFYSKKGLSYRQIASDIEKNSVSHTMIQSGIDGYLLPEEIVKLYPCVNSLGRPTILKLKKALQHKSHNEIVEHINKHENDLLQQLNSFYKINPSINCGELTKAISTFAMPSIKKKQTQWLKGINITKTDDDKLKSLTFNNPLSPNQQELLENFLNSLLE